MAPFELAPIITPQTKNCHRIAFKIHLFLPLNNNLKKIFVLLKKKQIFFIVVSVNEFRGSCDQDPLNEQIPLFAE